MQLDIDMKYLWFSFRILLCIYYFCIIQLEGKGWGEGEGKENFPHILSHGSIVCYKTKNGKTIT